MNFKGLAAAIAAALLAAPLAFAGGAHAAEAAKAPSKEQIARGQKDGPALIAATGVQCTPDTIYWMGSAKDPKTKAETNAYETSCKEGLGYLIVTSTAQPKPQAFDCLAAQGGTTKCTLPANADPKKGLGARAAAAGRPCDVTQATYNGTSAGTGESYYELACAGGAGFELGLVGPKVEINECIALLGSPRECKLTTAQQAAAALQPAMQAAGKPGCALKEARFVGVSQDNSGDTFYEVGCQSGPGYMLVVDPKLAYRRSVDCSRAQGIAGGCKLTDTTTTETAEAATYTKLAQRAGFPCQVSKYRFIGVDKQNREVVELACSNRPDGALAALTDSGQSEVYDCVRAGVFGQECKLTPASLVYEKYTRALAAKGKTTCKVSNARYVAASDTADYIETACSDGLPGWVIAVTKGSDTAQDVLNCKQAAASGARCTLPGNTGG